MTEQLAADCEDGEGGARVGASMWGEKGAWGSPAWDWDCGAEEAGTVGRGGSWGSIGSGVRLGRYGIGARGRRWRPAEQESGTGSPSRARGIAAG